MPDERRRQIAREALSHQANEAADVQKKMESSRLSRLLNARGVEIDTKPETKQEAPADGMSSSERLYAAQVIRRDNQRKRHETRTQS